MCSMYIIILYSCIVSLEMKRLQLKCSRVPYFHEDRRRNPNKTDDP